ncbi:hypothetical protein SDC9_188670 [bioreactor metagenome]|uniref:Uncharacterized protein n=1 Tax=bioreactor metagenome TaxID=1076179 RepID=A0A645HQ02_9ZZZZ
MQAFELIGSLALLLSGSSLFRSAFFAQGEMKRRKNDGARKADNAHLCAKREISSVSKNLLYFDNRMKYYGLTKLSDIGGQRRDIWSWNWEY